MYTNRINKYLILGLGFSFSLLTIELISRRDTLTRLDGVVLAQNIESDSCLACSSSPRNSRKLESSPSKNQHIQHNRDLPSTKDGAIFQQIVNYAIDHDLATASMGTIVQEVAKQFLGAKYQAGLLDRLDTETLIISLQEFDCLLLVETVLAIAKNIATQDYSYQSFTEGVENYRYRQGKIDSYCSRLHYFSDWINDNQQRGNVINITQNLGSVYLPKKLNFMTTHRSSYPKLVKSEANYQCVRSMEASLEGVALNYIPQAKIRQIYKHKQLQPGDIIGIATSISGLDVTHTGIAYRHPDGNIGLLHASPAGKVVIASDLQSYVSNVNQAIGITVTRIQDPR